VARELTSCSLLRAIHRDRRSAPQRKIRHSRFQIQTLSPELRQHPLIGGIAFPKTRQSIRRRTGLRIDPRESAREAPSKDVWRLACTRNEQGDAAMSTRAEEPIFEQIKRVREVLAS
jgi:hypothetical protein